MSIIQQAADSMAAGIRNFSNYTAGAAARANGVSATAQNVAGNYNASQSALANSIAGDRIAEQYQFNSAQAALANQISMDSWTRTAEWNEKMFQKMMDYNSKEAQINRDWQERMANTSYQRAVKDMAAAGLNPILAVTNGGISTGAGSGSAASVSSPSMSPINGQSASGGLLGANSASISGYSGQMEYMGGMLGMLSAALSGLSTAAQVAGQNGLIGDIVNSFIDYMKYDPYSRSVTDSGTGKLFDYIMKKSKGAQGSTVNDKGHGGKTGKSYTW